MKIVVATDTFVPRCDGVAMFLAAMLPELSRHHDVAVFAPDCDGPVPDVEGLNVTRFPLFGPRFGDYRFCRPSPRALANALLDADVLFNQSLGTVGQTAIAMALLRGVPVVSFLHSIDWDLVRYSLRRGGLAGFGMKWLARSYYNRCDLIVVPSEAAARKLRDNGVRAPLALTAMSVDTMRFSPPTSKAQAKRRLGLPADAFVVGYCGRLVREKNLPLLGRAFAALRARALDSRLLFVGDGLRSELPRVEGLVHAGWQRDVVPYLQAMDVFALTSSTETSSLATLEAMAVGVPVVVSSIGLEFVRDGENGLVVPLGDAAALAEALSRLLDPELRSKLATAARATAETLWLEHRPAREIERALASCVRPASMAVETV